MTPSFTTVRIGTRGSNLARVQTDIVADALRAAWPALTVEAVIIESEGDRRLDTPLPLIGGKGVFTEALEQALHAGEIDLAVHSLKDLPTQSVPGLAIGAIPVRGDAADVLISRNGASFADLQADAVIGTSSLRRAAQLRAARPDVSALSVRGNVETRLRKLMDPAGPYHAIVLAKAGLDRLGRSDVITETLPVELMLPAPGQGALGVQCRDEAASRELLAPLVHLPTAMAVTAERSFLQHLGGGCSAPVGAYAVVEGDLMTFRGRVAASDGDGSVDVYLALPSYDLGDAAAIGRAAAEDALANGAADYLTGASAWAD